MRPRFLAPGVLTGLCLAACAPQARQPDPFTETGRVIAFGGGDAGARNACFRCHGFQGEGDGRHTPALAGLQAGYLQKQLQDYAVQTRPDEVMTPIARQLDDDDRRAVAAWYASLTPVMAAPARTVESDLGRRIYLAGLPERGVQACAACHGVAGAGRGLANPALAGQPAAYTVQQLQRWKSGERRNDPRDVMGAVSRRLEDHEIAAVAQWLSARRLARRPDEAAAEASPEARRPGR